MEGGAATGMRSARAREKHVGEATILHRSCLIRHRSSLLAHRSPFIDRPSVFSRQPSSVTLTPAATHQAFVAAAEHFGYEMLSRDPNKGTLTIRDKIYGVEHTIEVRHCTVTSTVTLLV